MSIIKSKSDENFEAADLLINNNKLTSSIHCLYYGAYQRAMYTLNKCGVTYDEQKTRYTDYCNDSTVLASNKKKLGSHEFIIKEFISLLLNKKDNMALSSKMLRNFTYLRTLRKKADYANQQLKSEEVNECYERATSIKVSVDKLNGITV